MLLLLLLLLLSLTGAQSIQADDQVHRGLHSLSTESKSGRGDSVDGACDRCAAVVEEGMIDHADDIQYNTYLNMSVAEQDVVD